MKKKESRPRKSFTSHHKFKNLEDACNFIRSIENSLSFELQKYALGAKACVSDTNEVVFSISPFLLNLLDQERGRKPKAVLTFDSGNNMLFSKVEFFLTVGEAQARMFQHFKTTTQKQPYREKRNKYYHLVNDARTRILVVNKKTGETKYKWQIYVATNHSYKYGDEIVMPKSGIIIKGYQGYWNVVDEKVVNEQPLYLIENNFPRLKMPRLVINRYKEVIIEDVVEETLDQILKEEEVNDKDDMLHLSKLGETDFDLEIINMIQRQILKKEKGYE